MHASTWYKPLIAVLLGLAWLLAAPALAAPRPVLAVAPLDQEYPNIRRGFAALITQWLADSGRFTVLPAAEAERLVTGECGLAPADYPTLSAEQLAPLQGKLDLLLTGAVTAFTVADKDVLVGLAEDYNELERLAGTNDRIAQVRLEVRLVRVADAAEVLRLEVEGLESRHGVRIERVTAGWAGSVDLLSDEFRQTTVGRAAYKALAELLTALYERYPVTGSVLAVSGDAVVIDLDQRCGLAVGDELAVLRPQPITNAAGETVWEEDLRLGSVQVAELQPGRALCLVVESVAPVAEGDLVRPLVERRVLPEEAD